MVRLNFILNKLQEYLLDGLFVSNPRNIYYLTGFKTIDPTSRDAFVLVTRNTCYLFTDARNDVGKNLFFEEKKVEIVLLEAGKGIVKQLQHIQSIEKLSSLGFEKEDLKFKEYDMLAGNLSLRLVPVEGFFVPFRSIKSVQEIEKIAKACVIADESLRELVSYMKPDKSEKEIAWILEKIIREKGYEMSFEPIVAVTPNNATAHYMTKTGQGKVKASDMLLIDFGVKKDEYCCDMTRMFFIGDVKSNIKHTYDTLVGVQQKTIKYIQEHMEYKEVDAYCRNLLSYSYPHATGHGIGLEVHEFPKISLHSNDKVLPNQVITIEPGVYKKGEWGMRVEDTILIKNEGAFSLTSYPK